MFLATHIMGKWEITLVVHYTIYTECHFKLEPFLKNENIGNAQESVFRFYEHCCTQSINTLIGF